MRIVFVHRTVVDYTVESPYLRAVGGTEAAISYLAAELARLGHSVVHLANTSAPGIYLGVECLNHHSDFGTALLNDADVAVIANEAIGAWLRDMGVRRPLVLWVHHADDQPPIEPLEFSRERKAWSGFAFVSQWQMDEFCRIFWLARERAKVMRNAIAPPVAAATPRPPWYTRRAPPVLAYTSAPYRGLGELLKAFPHVRQEIPDVSLRIFAGLSTTRGGPDDNRYADLHRKCDSMEGVDYVGPVPQPELAKALAAADMLAYPCTYPETSCIAALEALAMGAGVVTTRLAALPETLAGHGVLIEPSEDSDLLAARFAATLVATLKSQRLLPAPALARRAAAISYVRQNYLWPQRAREWESWLTAVVQ
ncbi:MAG TPA: glycosyltransferase family 4 protein [Micropepsaceae bacterium]|nr:glycosyltransferase family 4 protein [Micropepsaceae bacterium]